MARYIYPAVLTFDTEFCVYLVSFYDLDLFTEGSTVEEAYFNAKAYLENYIACAEKFDLEINPPSTFEKTEKEFKDDKVIMIEANLEDVKIKKIKSN